MVKPLLIFIIFAIPFTSFAQNIGIGTSTPNASSLLEIKSTTQGFLIPRMTQEQRDAIVSPAQGLMIYQTDSIQGFYYYNGLQWNSTITQRNLILLRKYVFSPTSVNEIWMANIDGTDLHQVLVTLPSGIALGNEFRLTPNGDKIIFEASGNNISYIYSCNLNGSNVIKLIEYPLAYGSLILSGVF